ncbi:MAG: hypothetical protein BM549_03620 [Lacinutrix sp. MedPE-SW]|nr:MAG: hypothetical protein BM549_03620 [Lacinutrix sp. MedPE-SW]
MIIYPQINNLRIIIVPFIALLSFLGYYSISSYFSIEEYEAFFRRRKQDNCYKTFDRVVSYHNINVENKYILKQLPASKQYILKY